MGKKLEVLEKLWRPAAPGKTHRKAAIADDRVVVLVVTISQLSTR